jgi:hypothetical protein
VASIAYMDPGNFATNIRAGAKYGYSLLWVVLLANLVAMLFQGLSGSSALLLAGTSPNCAEKTSRGRSSGRWVVSEIAAMATDLAEFLGGAIGLSLLFHIPLLGGMAVTAVIVYGVLLTERRGFRPLEFIIGGLVAVIALCYLVELFIAPVDWGSAALHVVPSRIPDNEATAVRRWQRIGMPRPTLIDLHPTKPPESELDGGEGQEGFQCYGEILGVVGEPPELRQRSARCFFTRLSPPAGSPGSRT